VAISPKGDRYEGEWRDGTSNGKGVRAWPDGDRYEGEYRDGHENGKGGLHLREWRSLRG